MPVSYVLINVEPGSEEEGLKEVRKVPNVKDCHRIYGLYDMIAKVEADSMDGLKETITWKIGNHQALVNTKRFAAPFHTKRQ